MGGAIVHGVALLFPSSSLLPSSLDNGHHHYHSLIHADGWTRPFSCIVKDASGYPIVIFWCGVFISGFILVVGLFTNSRSVTVLMGEEKISVKAIGVPMDFAEAKFRDKHGSVVSGDN
jgi:hypothetical protein